MPWPLSTTASDGSKRLHSINEWIFKWINELANNTENFQQVAAKNTYDTPVGWTGRTKPAENHNGNALQ
ncbi:MAG: hypothetical protein PUD47_07170 [Bacteroidales bacterium]|nr:hypothetical protein [Bacteroidales bacterium]